MIIHFGEDTPDVLYMCVIGYHIYDRDGYDIYDGNDAICYEALLTALEKYKDVTRISDFFINHANFDKHSFNYRFEKKDNYSFGDLIIGEYQNVIINAGIKITFPIFVLKNKIWHEWSPEFDVFKPCEG